MKRLIILFLVSLTLGVSYSVKATTFNYGIAKTGDHSRPHPGTSLHNLIVNNQGCYIGKDDKTVYLTFDCGYENGYTIQILDALAKTNTKAIFFITGHYLTSSLDIVLRMLEDGHLIGNHSYKHINFALNKEEVISQDITALNEKYVELTGRKMSNYIRPPEGAISLESARFLAQNDYKCIYWSLAYVDWYKDKYYGNNYSYNIVTERIHNGAIILMHTVSKDNADDLESIIHELNNQGYRFGTINEII